MCGGISRLCWALAGCAVQQSLCSKQPSSARPAANAMSPPLPRPLGSGSLPKSEAVALQAKALHGGIALQGRLPGPRLLMRHQQDGVSHRVSLQASGRHLLRCARKEGGRGGVAILCSWNCLGLQLHMLAEMTTKRQHAAVPATGSVAGDETFCSIQQACKKARPAAAPPPSVAAPGQPCPPLHTHPARCMSRHINSSSLKRASTT